MEKTCPKCKVVKDYSDFYKSKAEYDGLSSYCKLCAQAATKEYREKHPEKVRASQRKSGRKRYTTEGRRKRYLASISTEKRRKAIQRLHRLRTYGMTAAEYNALGARQLWKCAICREGRPLHVDHDHSMGKVRGLLCAGCNTAIGKLGDNSEGVLRAWRYLSKLPQIDKGSAQPK
jgi:hypothetical protein